MTDLLATLVDLFEPFTRTALERQALLNRALGSPEFLKDVVWDGVSARTFVINTCVLLARQQFEGESALWQLLNTLRGEVGVEQQAQIDALQGQVESFAGSVKTGGTRVFLSYARADDEPFVKRLHNDLTMRGLTVWWDRVSMPNRGLTFLQEIRDAVDAADRFVLVAGEGAFQSDYVRAEWLYALSLCKPVNLALRKGNYGILPPELANFDAPDFRDDSDYNERLETLLRQLNDPSAPLGRLIGVSELPAKFLSRPSDMAALRDLIITDVQSPTVVSAQKRTTILEGMGGIGKSVLAAAFACDCRVRRAFPDGIIWLTAGQKPSLRDLYQRLGVALGDHLGSYPSDENTCKMSLQNTLNGRRCLILLDDVWEVSTARVFRDLIAGMPARLLISTRQLQISDLLGAQKHRVGLLDEVQSVALLKGWIGRDDPDLGKVAAQLGYLPLGLKLAGARMLKESLTGAEYAAKFDRVSRMKTERKATDRNDNLDVSITLGVEALFDQNESEKLLYYTLGIFPEDVLIPQVTVLRLWNHLHPDADPFDLGEILNELIGLALVERHEDKGISLHDLLHSYTREKLGERYSHTHHDLLAAFKAPTWADLPSDEPYLWHHLAYHLLEAGKWDQLRVTLLDYRFLEAKLRATHPGALVSDFDMCLSVQADEPLRLLRSALSMSANVLVEDIYALAHQLTGRLMLHRRSQSDIRVLTDALMRVSPDLLPLYPDTDYATHESAGGALICALTGHGERVNGAAWSPDGKNLVSASSDHTLRVWDAQNSTALLELTGHSSWVSGAVWSPDGKRLVSASQDKTLRVWDARSGACLIELIGHARGVNGAACSPDGTLIASASYDQTLRVWDASSGAFQLALAGHADSVTSADWSPDGARIVSASKDKTIRVWDLHMGTLVWELIGHTSGVNSAVWSPDGARIVSGSDDGTLRIWDARRGTFLHELTGHASAVNSVAWSPDGMRLVSASDDAALRVWDARTGALLLILSGHSDRVTCTAWSPGGKHLVSASDDATLRVWEVTNTTLPEQKGHLLRVSGVAWSSDGKHMVSASDDTTLRLWDGLSGAPVRTLTGHVDKVNHAAWSPDASRLVSASDDTTLRVWDAHSGLTLLELTGHSDPVRSAAWSPDGRRIVSASDDGTLRIWNAYSGANVIELIGHSWNVTSAAWSPDGKRILSSSRDTTLRVWDAHEGTTVFELAGHSAWVTSAAWSPDGRRIVSASSDYTLRIWDAQEAAPFLELAGHSAWVTSTAWSPDGKYVLSASSDRTLIVWEAETGKRLHTFYGDAAFQCCTWSPAGQIAAGDNVGRVLFLRGLG